jgi:hypothetical protein
VYLEKRYREEYESGVVTRTRIGYGRWYSIEERQERQLRVSETRRSWY